MHSRADAEPRDVFKTSTGPLYRLVPEARSALAQSGEKGQPVGAVLFIGMLLVIGTFFLRIALDHQGANSGIARWRAQFRGDEGHEAYEVYYAANRVIGWIGAFLAYLSAALVAVEALLGWPR